MGTIGLWALSESWRTGARLAAVIEAVARLAAVIEAVARLAAVIEATQLWAPLSESAISTCC